MSNKNRRYRAYAVEYTFCAHVTVDTNIMVLHTLRIVLLHHMIKKTYTMEPFGKPWNNDNAERKQTLVNSGKNSLVQTVNVINKQNNDSIISVYYCK